MDKYSEQILKELLPAEKEIVPTVKRVNGRLKEPAHLDHWSPPILLERAAYLRKLAKAGDGQASETLREYLGHATMLSFRSRDGEAELHEKFADIFHVLSGKATLVTGGIISGARTVAPGETRGDRIEGGSRQDLRAGDLAHVPAGLPHQMLVAGEGSFTAFVVKIKESEEP
jgi:mannose-6-phosphate isomerase-like protein (cupin superfamily)